MPRSRRRAPDIRPDRTGTRVGVYAGGGASHSWIWSVDALEREGFSGVVVLDEWDVAAGDVPVDVLVFGGGDPYGMGEALGSAGARTIRRFVEDGGRYLGFCAGAYLVAEVEPPCLRDFRLTRTGIGNVVADIPTVRALPTKVATVYGDRWVLHPAREGVRLQMLPESGVDGFLEAPLYGGAPLLPAAGESSLAVYRGFCRDTLFLVDPAVAEDMFLGAAAAVRCSVGHGRVYLFGPHLEAPGYARANELFGELVARRPSGGAASIAGEPAAARGPVAGANLSLGGSSVERSDDALRRHVGDARIAANAMVMHDVSWKLGEKFYEPAKIAVFLEAVWSRLRHQPFLIWPAGGYERACADARDCVAMVRRIGRMVRAEEDSTEAAAGLFHLLRRMTSLFLNAYFAGRRAEAAVMPGTVSGRAPSREVYTC